MKRRVREGVLLSGLRLAISAACFVYCFFGGWVGALGGVVARCCLLVLGGFIPQVPQIRRCAHATYRL